MRLFFCCVLMLLGTLFTFAQTEQVLEPITVKDVDASAREPVYFSLKNNAIVPAEEANSTAWDVAFDQATILINGGTSGPGQGGAAVLAANFGDVEAVTDNHKFLVDEKGKPAIPTGSGNGWYMYDFATHTLQVIPATVILIRTAEGHYAKLEILSYYRGAPAMPTQEDEVRWYTFRYAYQADGSQNLKTADE